MNRIVAIIGMIALISCLGARAQSVHAFARKSSSAIVLDGKLDESAWQGCAKIPLRHDIGSQLYQGAVENYDDCSMDFALLWNDEGLYCGSWTKDDIHNTSYANQATTASRAWQDDGNLWWVNFDFNDVWEDASPPYFGQFGWMVYKGFVWENQQASDLYAVHANGDQPTTNTCAELKEEGFEAPYWSADGISFQCEVRFKWSSFLLGSMAVPSVGQDLAFNIALSDNDGGNTGAAWLAWAEGMQHTYQSWGKVTIADQASTRPVRILSSHHGLTQEFGLFDVLGRQLRSNRGTSNGHTVVFRLSDVKSSTRSIRSK